MDQPDYDANKKIGGGRVPNSLPLVLKQFSESKPNQATETKKIKEQHNKEREKR